MPYWQSTDKTPKSLCVKYCYLNQIITGLSLYEVLLNAVHIAAKMTDSRTKNADK